MTDNLWFELPVKNLERAQKFYAELLKDNTRIKILDDKRIAILTDLAGKDYGCLYEESSFIPDMFGIIIYFEIFSDIREKIAKIKEYGGSLLSYENRITSVGFNALIQDSEGNRIAIFKQSPEEYLEFNELDTMSLSA